MPLTGDPKIDIPELIDSGYPQRQAVAIAMSEDSISAAGIMICCGDKMFLIQRNQEGDFPGTWAFPAGHIEQGETPEQAARREVFEETGHTAGEIKLVSYMGGFSLYEEQVGEMFVPVLNHESTGFTWVTSCCLPLPIHPGVRTFLDARAAFALDDGSDLNGYTARIPDINGWVEIARNPISKAGVFPYRGATIGAPDPDKIYMVLRPDSELGAPECIDSFKLLPWVDNHTMIGPMAKQIVTGAQSAEEKGVGGITGERVDFTDGILYSNIKLFSESMQQSIQAGKIELSAGYRCTYEFTPGSDPEYGDYEVVQRNIRGNHLALVKEGRCGPEIAVLDAMLDTLTITLDEKDFVMDKTTDKPAGEGEGGMTLAEMSKTLSEIVPAIAKINELLASLTKPADPAAVADPAIDADPTPTDEADPKPAATLDEAEITRKVINGMNLRAKLLADVSHFTGTFAADDMDLQAVAKYAVKKLEIPCVDGAEVGAVQAWLHGRTIPTATHATDSKPTGKGAVTATYAKE